MYRLGIFILFFTVSKNCFSLTPITYNGTITRIDAESCDYYLDNDCALDIHTIKPFLKKGMPKYDTLNQCFWQILEIKNGTDKNNLILEFKDPHIGLLEIYSYEKQKLLFTSGFGQNATEREISHKNHTFILNIDAHDSHKYILKFNTQSWAGFNGYLIPMNEFISYSLGENIALGIFYGILLLLLVYNFVLFFTNKQSYYLLYVLYILSSSLNSFNEDGIGFIYLWPDKITLNYFIYEYGSMILCFAFMMYSISFFGKKTFSQKKIIALSFYLITLHFVLKSLELGKLLPLTYSFFYLSILYFTTNKFRDLTNKFSFFNFGNIILITSFLVLQLRIFNLIPSNLGTVYFFNFGFIMEGIIFSYAMASRLQVANEKTKSAQEQLIAELKEKELLKDKVNRELELAVSKRTTEVEQQKEELVNLNKELKLYQEKLDHINSELDKDNWKLQKSLSTAKKEKILKRVSTYEEFKEVFKSNFECNNHLIELKWPEGFKCKKCKGKNFMEVNPNKKRKCTSCKHIESPTANTIFHGVKFPLSKAFYLIYFSHYNKKSKTIDELSSELELRRNTLWAFRKKVLEKREQLISEGKIKETSPWESVIIS